MEVLIKILQFVLSISILVVLHEFGHFIPARFFKTRVEKFYLFFDPWFSLFKFTRKGTEYGVGWLPLGGYVKISGMIDESMDKEQMKQPPQPHEFRAKKSWQRLIIMLGGVSVNVILAVVIYIGLLMTYGEQYLPAENVKYGIACDSLALGIGLQNGDKILAIDGKEVVNFEKIVGEIVINNAKTIQIERNNMPLEIKIPTGFVANVIENKAFDLIFIRFPFEVSFFTEESFAEKAGMQINDRIIGINGVNTEFFDQIRIELLKSKGASADVMVLRNNDTLSFNSQVDEAGMIGAARKPLTNYFEFANIEYNFFEAIPAGAVKAFAVFGSYIKQIKLMFSPETGAYKSLGGFIAIGNMFPAAWDWQIFWSFTAFLSIMLAVLNLLPIPALDGGHVVFLLYEMVTGRKPNDKVMEYVQTAGMILLLALVLYANANDVIKLFVD